MDIRYYLLRRSVLVVMVVIGTITVTFFLSRVIPSNPAILLAGQNPTPDQIERITREYGLDQPLIIQYFNYLKQIFSGNLGISYSFSLSPVLPLIEQALPNSFTLGAISTFFAAAVGIPLGIEAAKRGGKKVDSLLRIFSVSSVALPQFWLGLMLQLIFAVYLKFLPLASYGGTITYLDQHPISQVTGSYLIDSLISGKLDVFLSIVKSMILPVFTLSFYTIGVVIRQTRASMLGVLSENFIRTAKAYGLPERKIYYSLAFRNALPPVVVTLALAFAYSSTIGVVYVEEIFALNPGLGFLVRYSTGTGVSSTGISGALDYQLILAIAILSSIVYAISNFVADMVQIYFDRRILK
jgi:peptide/nickel transport system permease protein